ncbi:hypothetical protein C7T35_26460 [Variovorax sp. WS11]|uniref:hypothetical protein n=1 Tax=Variovorax sp. WS11 TaxID=1105204 RepID=UPI000D0CCB06|nr:hypothetical protein [Variovorax sp. WS11]NDZ13205.1 hypothetical protein [Variovorax sp. WS11]PSL81553.1 hypothetical protein C7T35_26460 [Variovorax sp. WS11]
MTRRRPAPLTRSYTKTVSARAHRDPSFVEALLREAASAHAQGELEVAFLLVRDLYPGNGLRPEPRGRHRPTGAVRRG